MHRRRIDAPPERVRERAAAALEATDAVAAYAEDDDGVRAKVGSYGVASQGYDLRVAVVGEDDGTTVTVTGDYVLFGAWSLAPEPRAFVDVLAEHLDRALLDEATPTGDKRVASPATLDGLTLPSGRTVPLATPFVAAGLVFAAYLAVLLTVDFEGGVVAAFAFVFALAMAGLSGLATQRLQRQASDSPDSTAR